MNAGPLGHGYAAEANSSIGSRRINLIIRDHSLAREPIVHNVTHFDGAAYTETPRVNQIPVDQKPPGGRRLSGAYGLIADQILHDVDGRGTDRRNLLAGWGHNGQERFPWVSHGRQRGKTGVIPALSRSCEGALLLSQNARRSLFPRYRRGNRQSP